MVLVCILAAAAHTATAQEPRPESLWEAYPLDPGQEGSEPADPAPTPTPAPRRRTGSPGSPAVTEAEDDDGAASPLLIGVTAFAIGLGAGAVVRNRRRRAAVAPVTELRPVAAPPPQRPAVAPPRRRPASTPKRRPPASAPPRRRPAPAPPPPPAPEPEPTGPIEFLPPSASPSSDAELTGPSWRFARRPWPDEATRAWTCEIDWKPGYVRSGFRAMVAPPGETRRTPFGQSRPIRWMLMSDPEPPTEEMVETLRELVTALTEDGWVRIGPAGRWYSQRFLWAGKEQPRPLEPQTGKEANA